MKYERHAYSEVFGDMDDESFKALVDDISDNGLKEKIAIFEGKIIDGWHRYKACLELDMQKIPMFEWEGADPISYVFSRNHHRRHSTPSQRALAIAKILELSRKRGGNTNFWKRMGNFASFTLDQAAQVAQVSRRTMVDAKVTADSGIDEVQEAVKSGDMSISEAAAISRQDPEQQKKTIAKRKNKPKAEKKAPESVPMNVYKELQSAYDEMVSNYDAMAVELQALDAYKDNRQVEEMRKMLIQIDSLKKLNDDLMNKNVELVKQVNYWKKKAKG